MSDINNPAEEVEDNEDILRNQRLVKVAHHKHTGKFVPIKYTSYALLYFVIIVVCLLAFFIRQSLVNAGPPQSLNGDILLSGVVPNNGPPTIPASITDPTDNSHFTEPIYTVKGTCTAGLYVELYRNDAFAGIDTCDSSGNFQITTTLLSGLNKLVARISDSNSQYGPDSQVVNVYYDIPSPEQLTSKRSDLTPESVIKLQNAIQQTPLLVYSKTVHTGYISGGNTKITYEITGGTASYAVSIDWGDGSQLELEPHTKAGKYTSSIHRYERPGQYIVKIHVSDTLGQESTIQVLVVVNGNKAELATLAASSACVINDTAPTCPLQNQLLNKLDLIWPAIIGSGLMAISFWLGERVVYARIAKSAQSQT